MSLVKKAMCVSAFFFPLMGGCLADDATPKSVTGYKIMSGDDYSLTIGGRVRVQGFYDVDGKQPGSPYGLDDANIPLKKTPVLDSNAYKKGNFNYNLQGSQFSLDAHKKLRGIDYRGYLELDFNGNGSTTSNSYTPRIRYAYFEACGWLVGQTRFTFMDGDSFIYTLDNIYGADRHAMIQFTHNFTPELTLAMAAERPNTQVYQIGVSNADGTATIAGNTGYFDNDASAPKSQVPDGAMKLKYKSNWGHVALRGVLRDLQVRIKKNGLAGGVAVENFKESKLGWGVGLSTRLNIFKNFGILVQGNYGKGIGKYIDDLANSNPYDSFLVIPVDLAALGTYRTFFKPAQAWNLIGGFEVHFTDKLWSNFAYSYTRISLPKIVKSIWVNSTNQVHRKLQCCIGNIIYEILPNTQIGLEVLHYRRKAGTSAATPDSATVGLAPGKKAIYTGKDTRILVGLNYII